MNIFTQGKDKNHQGLLSAIPTKIRVHIADGKLTFINLTYIRIFLQNSKMQTFLNMKYESKARNEK